MSVNVKYSTVSNDKDRHVNHCDVTPWYSLNKGNSSAFFVPPTTAHTNDSHAI